MAKDCIVVHYKTPDKLDVYRVYAWPEKAGGDQKLAKFLCCRDVQEYVPQANEIHAEIRILWEIDQ